jgi:hypothetical protein
MYVKLHVCGTHMYSHFCACTCPYYLFQQAQAHYICTVPLVNLFAS